MPKRPLNAAGFISTAFTIRHLFLLYLDVQDKYFIYFIATSHAKHVYMIGEQKINTSVAELSEHSNNDRKAGSAQASQNPVSIEKDLEY